jgi:ABC-2 type transport system permease protein
MRTLVRYFRLYFIIEAQYIKARMQYRADFIISSIGMFFTSLASLAVFWVLFNSITTLAGWTLMEMVFIYAFYMIAISPMQILFDQFWNLRYDLQQGTFLKFYFRPLNMMFYYISERFDLIVVLASCAAFWVLNSFAVLNLAWKLREFAPYPINIFDGAFRFTFTFLLPIGFVAFYPSQLFLRPQEVPLLVYFSPLVGIALFALTYWVWKKGVNQYTGTGS